MPPFTKEQSAILLGVLGLPAATPELVREGLIHYWKPKGGSDHLPIPDVIGGVDIQPTFGNVAAEMPPFPGAVQFNAANSHLSTVPFGIDKLPLTQPFTVDFFMEVFSLENQGIFGQWGNPNFDDPELQGEPGTIRKWAFAIADGKVEIRLADDSQIWIGKHASHPILLEVGERYYVRGGWDGRSSWIQVNQDVVVRSTFAGPLSDTLLPLQLGGFSEWNQYFNGRITDIAMWDRWKEDSVGDFRFANGGTEIPLLYDFQEEDTTPSHTEFFFFAEPHFANTLNDPADSVISPILAYAEGHTVTVLDDVALQITEPFFFAEGEVIIAAPKLGEASLRIAEPFMYCEAEQRGLPAALFVVDEPFFVASLVVTTPWVGPTPPTENVWRLPDESF